MSVFFSVAKHGANPVNFPPYLIPDGFNGEQILENACGQRKKAGEILQFAISPATYPEGYGRDFTSRIPKLVPNQNGFVHTVITAYNEHHALVLRPDDVWLAILCQFNFFVNGNAELLRASFVAHEGKRMLAISAPGDRYSMDFGDMARQMTGLIHANVVDPTLRDWVMPDFSTTTVNDTTVSAILMMATLKEYFVYAMFGSMLCGIPRVMLEGEKADWVNVLGRLEKLKEYGIETIAWYHLLHPVISRIAATFDAPESAANVDFWQKIAHYENGGSGPSYYSGWINAFNVFSKKGVWLGNRLDMNAAARAAPETLTAAQFWATYSKPGSREELVLDGTPYHRLQSSNVPPGYAEVDVTLIDREGELNCSMFVGVIGMGVSSSGDRGLSAAGENDTVRPVAGWWMCTKDGEVVGPGIH